jgi:sialate O-acetylesterase
MQHQLDSIDNPQEELNDVANYPQVRTFFASLEWSNTPLIDLKNVYRNWAIPTAGNMAQFSAVCWLFGRNLYRKNGVPVGMIETNWGGTRIEAWSSPDTLTKCFTDVPYNDPPNGASQLYNAMIHPFLPMPIYGGIWYQGESNTGNAQFYGCAIKAMVNDWREQWHAWSPEMNPAFPFGQVQLAPWRNQDIVDGFTNLRWSQTDSYGYVPNANMNNHFLAVAIDLPDFASPYGDIHPRYKRQIADRLALAALNVAYGQADTGIYQGPLPTSITINGGNIRVTYGVQVVYRTVNPNNFEICCGATPAQTCLNGGRWVGTAPVAQSATYVDLANTCNGGESVTGYRYLWRESPCALEDCPVYSVENDLPAPPCVYHATINADSIFYPQ